MKPCLQNLHRIALALGLFLCCLTSSSLKAQRLVNVNYMRVTETAHNFQCCDDALACCGGWTCAWQNDRPEPRYKVTGNAGATNNQTTINQGNSVSCGTYSQNRNVLTNVNGICANSISVNVDMWEEDNGDDNNFDGSFPNVDDNRTQTSANFTLSGSGATQIVDLTGSGGYRVRVELSWTVVAAPTLAGTSVTSVCNGSQALLVAQTSQTIPGGTFEWYTAATGGTSIFTGSTYQPTITGNVTYYLAYSVSGCETERTPVTVTMLSATAPTATSPVSVCPNTSASLTASATGSTGINWYADPAKVSLLGTGASYTTPPVTANTTFYVSATYPGGCESPLTAVDVQLLPAPAAPTIPATVQFCEGNDVILTAVGGTGTINWYTTPVGGAPVATGATANFGSAFTTGFYTYYVAEDDGSCESLRSTVTVEVLTKPNKPLANATTVCPNTAATLSASEASAVNFNWYTSPTATVPVATGAVFTTANITGPTTFYVTSINADGCESDTTQVLVDIINVANPTVTGTTTVCPGETTVLTATASTATSYNWYQNSDKTGFLAAGSTLTTLPLNNTTIYYVAAVYPNGCESLLTAVTVNVSAAPTAPIAMGVQVCANEDLVLTAAGSGGTLAWYATASTTTALATGSTYNAGQMAAGTYTYFVEEQGATCTSTRTAVLALVDTVPSAPVLRDTVICANEMVTLAVNGSNHTYHWYSDLALTNLVFSGQAYTTPVLTSSTSYYVVAVNSMSCQSAATTVNVTVNALPTALTVNPDTICVGETAQPSVVATGNTVNWFANSVTNTVLNTGASYTITNLTQSTTYFVDQTDAQGCTSPRTAVGVEVNALPNQPNSNTVTALCEGDDVILSATGSGTGDLVFYDASMVEINRQSMAGNTLVSYNAGTMTAGNYLFFVAEESGDCVSAPITIAVTVNALPAAPVAGATTVTICAGNTATLSASASGVIQWMDKNMNVLATGTAYTTAALTTNDTFYVKTTSAQNCESATTMIDVVVDPLPVAPVAMNDTICAGGVATLTAMGTAGTLSWYSDAQGANLVATGATLTMNVVNQTTTYYVQEMSAGNCLSPITAATIVVNPALQAPAANSVTICEGEDAVLSVTGLVASDIVIYDASNAEIHRAAVTAGALTTTTTLTGLTAGTYVFTTVAESGDCVSAPTTILVTVQAAPTAPVAVATTTTICEGQTATLAATANATVIWMDKNMNTLATGISYTTPVLMANDTFYVKAVGNNGCESVATMLDIVVDPLPTAPVVTNDTICAGGSATLTAAGAGGTLNWYSDAQGANLLATGATFNLAVVNQTTTYYVQEVSAGNCLSPVVAATVEVNPALVAPAASNVEVCAGSDVVLTATGTTTADLVFYDASNVEIHRAAITPINPTATHTISGLAAGSYVFTVVAETADCASLPTTILATVNAQPMAPTISGFTTVCAGEDIVLQASTVASATYLWTGPNGFTATGQNLVITEATAADAGQYEVQLSIGTCQSAVVSTTVSVDAVPATPTLTNNGPLCEGEDLVISSNAMTNVSYAWSGPLGLTSTADTMRLAGVNAINHQGFYTLVVTDQTTNCSSDPAATLVTINALPSVSAVMNNSPVCTGGTVEFSVPEVFNATYLWTGPNGFTATTRNVAIPNASAATEGTYTVAIAVGNCSVNLSTVVSLAPVATITTSADTTVDFQTSLQLFAAGGAQYQWSPAGNLDNANLANPVFTANTMGANSLNVMVTDINGCQYTETVFVNVTTPSSVKVVDLFTPNGDGVNDTWELDFLQFGSSHSVKVFTRGGMQVFVSENYSNDWDGTSAGKQLPDGTYYYIIQLDDKEYKGAVTIKR